MTFKNFFVFLIAALAVSSPSLAQTAVPPIAIEKTQWASAYLDVEKLILKNISNGPKVIWALSDFDYEVANEASDSVERQVLPLTRTVGLNESTVGRVKEFVPEWAFPIYEYVEGLPEGHLIGNIGQVTQPYQKVNAELRDDQPDSEETKVWVKKMRNALDRLPKFEGLSFRGTRLRKENIDKFYPLEGRAIDGAFISTSMLPSVAERFAFADPNLSEQDLKKIGVIFIIKGKTGRPVSTLGDDHDDEAEILFKNGTPFKVVAKSPLFQLGELQGRYQVIFLIEETE